MGISAGPLNIRLPQMQLTFFVRIARPADGSPTGKNVGLTRSWTIKAQNVPCDIAPLKDDLYFAQSGQQNIPTHTLHFNSNTDIRPRDNVQLLTNVRLAGPIGSWFEITERLEPTETIAYVRCYARIVTAPKLL